MAVKVGQIELTDPIEEVPGAGPYEGVRLLVRYRGEPLGWISLDNADREEVLSRERVRREITTRFPWELAKRVLGERFRPGPVAKGPRCSVVVCTRGRTARLHECLGSLVEQDLPAHEILVVDSAASDGAAEEVASSLSIDYVREDRPGLSRARNRGLREARGDVVAFVSDDVRPDPGWLRAITRAFIDPDVAVVVGSAAADELDAPEQTHFELELRGPSRDPRRRRVRSIDLSRAETLRSIWYGVGTNVAFRRAVFEDESGFDPALDVGSEAGYAVDLEMCHRLVAGGRTLLLEPAALVWYSPERSRAGLERQLHARGVAFGAYVLASARTRNAKGTATLLLALRKWLWRSLLRRLLRPGPVPRSLVWAELRGALWSPFASRRARKAARTLADRSGEGRERGRGLLDGEGVRA